jgi:DNA helicase-2/ATP-dependent DNA helicase PcrA
MNLPRAGRKDDVFNSLNEHQLKAINHLQGPSVLAACAGSGKTRVVVLRMLNLLMSGVPPGRIGAFTFAKDAAREMQERGETFGFPKDLRIGTLHSLCWEIVQNDGHEFDGPQLTVNETKTYYQVKTVINFQFKRRGLDPSIARKLIGLAKAHCLSLHPKVGTQYKPEIIELFKRFADKPWLANLYVDVFQAAEQFRTAEKIVDFEDMLVLAWLTLVRNPEILAKWQSRFDYLLVDEAQDSSRVQNAIVELLAKKHNNLMLIGDLCQSIYSWRGAQPKDFLKAAKDSTLLTLPVNYRSTVQICNFATNLVVDKEWNLTGATLPAPGAPDDPASAQAVQFPDAEAEALAIAADIKTKLLLGAQPRDIAILYRVTWLLIPLERALMNAQIPYTVWSGMNFFERREVKDLVAYLRVAALRDPDESNVKRALNAPFRYIGKASISDIEDHSRNKGVAFLDVLRNYNGFKPQQETTVRDFYLLLADLNQMVSKDEPPKEILEYILSETKYLAYLNLEEGEGGPDPEGGKAPNVHQLVDLADEFSDVSNFLDFVDDIVAKAAGARKNRDANAVVLSSIHKSKGLEWDHVYGVGWNMGILPHALNPDPDEERRLAYVCLTRARKRFQASFYDKVVTATGVFEGKPSLFIAQAGLPVHKGE